MPVAADDRARVFEHVEEKPYLLNEDTWIDFYVLLKVERGDPASVLEDAIVARGAEVLALTFARGVPERMRLLERYLPDLRLIFLDAAIRRRYDEQLALHESGSPSAVPFEVWRKTSIGRVARIKQSSASFLRRIYQNVWESEYI
jgi:hypothetical protein